MIEGQEGVTWPDWLALSQACEEAGFEGLFRSDHYVSVQGRRERGSLDAWTTLAALAAVTTRIRLGTLVSPATFRHPSLLAKSAVTVDHISGGRAEVGLGAGWYDAEHSAYGFPFPSTGTRMQMLAEQLEVVHRQWSEGSFSFDGQHYRVQDLDGQPKPVQRPHPTLIVGGVGGRRSLALAARWADEYNTVYLSPARCAELRGRVVEACDRAGRDPATLSFSLMTVGLVGTDEADVRRQAQAVMALHGSPATVDDWLAGVRESGVVGTVEEAVAKLGELEAAGVQRVMLQHHAHRDLEMVRLIGEQVIPKVA